MKYNNIMEITLDPELEKFIRNQVQSGQYCSLDEAINVALRLLATQTLASQGINKTPNVCSGDACVGKTRIPVWSLVSDRRLGMSDPEILAAFPTLSAVDLVNAWVYAERHLEEIESAIRENEVIMETEVE
ncbi:MAG: DUF433 domain-containing protein [Trichodesmium sp. St16_bin2-tuft]|nr:DUF433 domain-containing protein [Trichodesmium sp. St16_bin2-tuft]